MEIITKSYIIQFIHHAEEMSIISTALFLLSEPEIDFNGPKA